MQKPTSTVPASGWYGHRLKDCSSIGFTLIEMLLAIVILGTLAALAIPNFNDAKEKAKVARAIGDLRALSTDLSGLDPVAADLGAIGRAGFLDPWGNPYQYMPIDPKKIGGARKDKFLVPLNSDFDLYSMGPDGASMPPLTAKASKDDIIRANDGGYVGKASTY